MVKNHIKSITAPRTWRIQRKEDTFITRPKPGRKLELCMALSTVLRRMTGLAGTEKEAKYLLTYTEVLVNGKRRRDHRYPVGYLDVVSVPAAKKTFRLIIDKGGSLKAKEISAEDSDKTLLRITSKTVMPGGKLQINTMSGTNLLTANKEDAKNYKIGDSLLISIKDSKVHEHLSREKGNTGFVFIGKHTGKIGTIENIDKDLAKIKTKDEEFETKKDYVFVIGKDKPLIDMMD